MKENDLAIYIAKNVMEDKLIFSTDTSIVTIFEWKSNNPNGPGINIKFTNEFMDMLRDNKIDVIRLKTELNERNIHIMNKNLS